MHCLSFSLKIISPLKWTKGKIMRKIWKLIPLILTPLLLSSCNIISPKAESVSQDVHSDDTEDIDGVKVTLSGDSKVVAGNKVTLTLSMDPSDQMPSKKITWKSSDNTILKKVTTGTTKTACEFNALALGKATVSVSSYFANDTNRPFTKTFELEVIRPQLTGITISSPRENMGLNSTMTFSVSPTPGGAELPEINWSVDKTNLASISNTGVLTSYSSEGSVVVTAKTADNRFESSKTIQIQKIPLDKWTIMMYMCGSSLESGSDYGYDPDTDPMGYCSEDIDEILATSGKPDSVNIIMECGGSLGWKNTKIRQHKDKLSRWHVDNQQIVWDEDKTYTYSMGTTSTFQEFLEWGFDKYPAEHYGVILWNHGGAMKGVCFDEVKGDDALLSSECEAAVTAARNNYGITSKLDFITYDACLMCVQDIAEYNSKNFNYMLSSQEVESGSGYDYDAWLPYLYTRVKNGQEVHPGELLKEIAVTFMREVESGREYDQTQSVINLTKIDTYVNKLSAFAKQMDSKVTSWNTFKSLMNSNVKRYGSSANYRYDVFDAEDVFDVSDDNYSGLTTVSEAKAALSDLVYYEQHGYRTSGCGLSMFIPVNGYYRAAETHLTAWYNFCKKSGLCY